MSDTYPPGAVIGGYQIIRPLQAQGAGAASHVYLARPRSDAHVTTPYVVIKIIFADVTAPHAEQGAPIDIRPIEHPNLVRMLPVSEHATSSGQPPKYVAPVDPGDPGSPWYVVFEYLPGGSLRHVLARCGRLSPAAAVEIALQVCRGLARMHEQHVLHLDIKPENILLREPLSRWQAKQPQVVIADLGTDHVWHRRRAHSTYATRAYLAPERAAGRTPEPCHDVFSLGVVLFEMLTGRRPYGDDAPATQMLDEVADRLLSKQAGSPDLAQLVRRAIDRNPDRRYSSVAALQADLERLPIERPGRIKLPVMSGALAYGVAALVPLVLLLLLVLQLISLAPPPGTSATPTAVATIAPPTRAPDATPTIEQPIPVVSPTLDRPQQPTAMLQSTSTLIPTSTLLPPASPAP